MATGLRPQYGAECCDGYNIGVGAQNREFRCRRENAIDGVAVQKFPVVRLGEIDEIGSAVSNHDHRISCFPRYDLLCIPPAGLKISNPAWSIVQFKANDTPFRPRCRFAGVEMDGRGTSSPQSGFEDGACDHRFAPKWCTQCGVDAPRGASEDCYREPKSPGLPNRPPPPVPPVPPRSGSFRLRS